MTDRQPDQEIEHIAEETRAFVTAKPAPDVTAAVMRRVAQIGAVPARPGPLRRLAELLWSPREIQLRPAYGLAAAAALVLLIIFLPAGQRIAPVDPRVFVQFHLEAADAMDVRLAGSFTNWQPRYELHESSPGVWTITLPLSAGVHDYAFVVDGQRWMPDPYATKVDDGFGGVNSRIALVVPDASRL